MPRANYTDKQDAELEVFLDDIHGAARDGHSDAVLDSAAIKETARSVLKSEDIHIPIPACVQRVIDLMPEEDQSKVLDSVLKGAEIYRREHGVLPTGDVVHAAMQQAVAASKSLDRNGNLLDSVGSTDHHDSLSAQPNRIIVAVTSALAEGIPFAGYLPTDIGSNEARLAIINHQAGSTFGGYTQTEIMDGVNIGKPYMSAERRVALTLNAGRDAATGKVTGVVGGTEDTPLLRGRTLILVNGFPCAAEAHNNSSAAANSPISGSINLSDTDYAITGAVTVATGAISLAFAPALPAGTVVHAEGFIDFETGHSLIPRVVTEAPTFSLFATPWHCLNDQTISSKTQYSNELGLDLQNESLLAIRNQNAMERHRMALAKLLALAPNNTETFDFGWSTQGDAKTRTQIWGDFMASLGRADQKMAEDTMDHGITHLYVPKSIAAQMRGLPREIFEPSGVVARPGIFRLGRLFGLYDVYYTPNLLNDTGGSAQVLAIGRSNQVARNPIILGDAVAATYMPMGMLQDFKSRTGFYGRNFTSINPHIPSAKGAALINVTNMGV